MARKVVGYARINSGNESDLEQQINCLKDVGVVEVFVDVATGSTEHLAELKNLVNSIDNDQIDEVVVTRFDRLGRSLFQLSPFFEACRKKNIKLRVLQQHSFHTAEQRSIVGFLELFLGNGYSSRNGKDIAGSISFW